MNTLSQQEFVALFDNAAMGIITIDPSGKVVLANNCAMEQFRSGSEGLVGLTINELIPGVRPTHEEPSPQAGAVTKRNGNGSDHIARRRDGSEFPVEISFSRYTKAEGRFSIVFISDITVRKASENALKRLNDDLERKVEERTHSLREALEREKELGELKSRFVSMASHEFRTPLSIILSSACLISRYKEAEEQPRRDKHIDRIIHSVNSLTDILNDFLSVGRIEEGRVQVRMQKFVVPGLLHDLVGELEQTLGKGQYITYSHDGEDEVVLDPNLLKHIVQNLISNARKFSPEYAVIDVSTAVLDDTFILSVTDKGIGISDADQKHLFERFFRGTNAGNVQGTGLGLHIVRKYAELMRGVISCQSEPGTGTTFMLEFDLSK